MDLSLTPVQTMLRDAARSFLASECPRTYLRELDESETGFDPALWRKMAGLGWPGLSIPERFGGTGGSCMDTAILLEEHGYAGLWSPLHASSILAALTLLAAGSAEQQQHLLPGVADGSRILGFAFSEPDYGWAPQDVQLRASPHNGGFTLSGTKLFVPFADVADQLLVVARTARDADGSGYGLTTFLVDRTTPGVEVKGLHGYLIDHWTQLDLQNVPVPASAVVGAVDQAWSALEPVFDRASALLCAYMVGAQQRIYEMTAEYARNRVHFGQPIAQFQRVQDYIIDALNMADESRWTTYEALAKLDAGEPDAAEYCSIAKAVTSDAFRKADLDAHHVHAGTGGDRTYGLYLYTQKAKALHSYLGDPTYHRLRVADFMHV